MTIGIDISDLKVAATGQKTFLEELCKQLSDTDECRFVFFSSPLPRLKGRSKIALLGQHILFQTWKQVLLPIKAFTNNCTILFCSDYFVPFFHLGFKSIQVFHDAFFFENPEHYNKYWFYLHKHLAMPAAKKSSRIIVPSNYALQTVHAFAGIPMQKLVRIYEAPKTLELIGVTKNDPTIASFINDPYLFHVGVMEKRKNIPRLIHAFNRFIQKGAAYSNFKLVLAGKGTGRKESDDTNNIIHLIASLNLQHKVILTGYLSDAQLKTVYENAFMYVFPSLNEGFGIPVLEAFKANIPVIVANNSCLPEIGGDAVIGFDPFNEHDICDTIQLVVDNTSLRNDLLKKGQDRLLAFSWEKTAKELLDVFRLYI